MNHSEKKYDLFISHASEDKEVLVRPLANTLKEFGVSVWYDEFTLKIGDGLRKSIDRGLAESHFGLVILSPNFFMKNWTEYELNGLTAIEIDGSGTILPIWYNLDRKSVLEYSPPLADKVAIVVEKNSIIELTCKIIEVVKPALFEKILRRATYFKSIRKISSVNPALLKCSLPRHEKLPLNLISRIRLIRSALLEVIPNSMNHWIDGFCRDSHPTREIRIWEHIATCYLEYNYLVELTLEQRKSALQAFLYLSLSSNLTEFNKLIETLPLNASETILLLWKNQMPAFDIKHDFFPENQNCSIEEFNQLKCGDTETFPFDLPDELIKEWIYIEEPLAE